MRLYIRSVCLDEELLNYLNKLKVCKLRPKLFSWKDKHYIKARGYKIGVETESSECEFLLVNFLNKVGLKTYILPRSKIVKIVGSKPLILAFLSLIFDSFPYNLIPDYTNRPLGWRLLDLVEFALDYLNKLIKRSEANAKDNFKNLESTIEKILYKVRKYKNSMSDLDFQVFLIDNPDKK
jgi:hypothetical protein